MNILATIGNLRLEGNTNYLVEKTLVETAKLGARTEKVILNQYEVNPCLGHDDCATLESCQQRCADARKG